MTENHENDPKVSRTARTGLVGTITALDSAILGDIAEGPADAEQSPLSDKTKKDA